MPAFNRNSLTIETALDIIDKGKKDGQTDTPYPRLIATSATAFAAPLSVDSATKAAHWRVKLSADGRSQELLYDGGLMIEFR